MCGLAYPYDWKGFVGTKEDERGHLSKFVLEEYSKANQQQGKELPKHCISMGASNSLEKGKSMDQIHRHQTLNVVFSGI